MVDCILDLLLNCNQGGIGLAGYLSFIHRIRDTIFIPPGNPIWSNQMKFAFEDLQKIIKLHSMFLSGEKGGEIANLKCADLYGTNLMGANLMGASMEGASFKRAILMGADLEGAKLDGANFKRAILEGANLKAACLKGACLMGVNLEHADLRSANLEYAALENADLKGAKYNYKTVWPENYNPKSAGAILVDD
jgi:hypothetical protein